MRDERGQMTVELAVVFPVVLVVAAIVVNALLFISECAAFDRSFPQAVRLCIAPPYGTRVEDCSQSIQESLSGQFANEHAEVSVSVGESGFSCVSFTGELIFSPTLFGMGLRSEVLGVQLPRAVHRTQYVVDPYRSGIVA